MTDERSKQKALQILEGLAKQLGPLRAFDSNAIATKVLKQGRYKLHDNGVWSNALNVRSDEDVTQALYNELLPYRTVASNPDKQYVAKYEQRSDSEAIKRVKNLLQTYIKANNLHFKKEPDFIVDQIAKNFDIEAGENGTPMLVKQYKGMFSKPMPVEEVFKSNLGDLIDHQRTEFAQTMHNANIYSQLGMAKYGKLSLEKEEFEEVKAYAQKMHEYNALPPTDYKAPREEQLHYQIAIQNKAMFDLDIVDPNKLTLEQQSALKMRTEQEIQKMNSPKIEFEDA